MIRLPSVQRFYVRLQGIVDDTLYLADGRPRAIFQVETADLLLADEQARETETTRLEAFLQALRFLVQIVYRLVPTTLDDHAAETEALAATRQGRLAAVGRQQAAFLRHLGRTGNLLQPQLFVVVGLDGTTRRLGTRVLAQVTALARWRLARRRHAAEVDPLPSATEQLDERGEALAAALDRLGVRWQRLDNDGIAALLAACWCPERARRQRLGSAHQPLRRTPADRSA